MDLILRLYRLGLLPASVAALEGEDAETAAGRLPRASAPRNASSAPSLLSRAFARCRQSRSTSVCTMHAAL